jgi:hypothetical protein
MNDDVETHNGTASKHPHPEMAEVVKRMTKDMVAAATTMSADEARFLVDAYYAMQENRIRTGGQIRALSEGEEPHDVLGWLNAQDDIVENQIRRALHRYAESKPLGEWAMSIIGIGPVITAGLLAHVNFEPWACAIPLAERKAKHKCSVKAPCTPNCRRQAIETVGHLWRFAGLDPTSSWGKGQKRPWNAALKRLTWIIGESFVKVSGSPDSFYGQFYKARKTLEQERNDRGEFAEQARKALETKIYRADTTAKTAYEAGKLPPAHIHARAKRYAVKLFLAHYFEVGYRLAHGREPPLPYAIAKLCHAHRIPVPAS